MITGWSVESRGNPSESNWQRSICRKIVVKTGI